MRTAAEQIQSLTYFDLVNKLKRLFKEVIEELQPEETVLLSDVTPLGTTTNITAIAGTYSDLPAARTSVNALRTDVEARLDAIEAKLDAVINSLKA